MLKVSVRSMESQNGNNVPNQFIIDTDDGIYFQSYRTVIALKQNGKIYLDKNSWDYSRTTGKYRNQFLNENKAETERKIKSGEYELIDLN
ncbi:MAG TPA: hypothetical protein VMQ58_00995 [Candidatus Saccharimonadales bacterium]|nr:hypothetical protein [Candidatus Saccharimonadales bacterium]